MKKHIACFVFSAWAAFFLFIVYVNIDAIAKAYGAGPPYYGRTTNMDKWENPVPTLVVLDIASLLVLFVAFRWTYPRIRGR